ncbi:hypothetical protein FOA52_007844 [Chlamydomonas sp. UWO 241]|nr:hypothetical protein FOA52_007844 [Chlamydomonas sp. UWO 241]
MSEGGDAAPGYAEEEPEEERAGGDTTSMATAMRAGGLDPDHPLLARAQAALKKQLLENKKRVADELRAKNNELVMAKKKRETIGVELYGFQQGLAKLQMSLETTHENFQDISRMRAQTEDNLSYLKQALDGKSLDTKHERARVEKHAQELDRLGATLKQIEAYNEEMKSEIAVTRRAAYAAESQVQKLEREKMEQDVRIEGMQESIKSLGQTLQLHSAQLEAQKRETRAALETLAEAESEMESVHFEKKQLVAQWKSSLAAIQKRDEALSEIQGALRDQAQQQMTMENEIDAYKKDIVKQQISNESLTALLKKVEGDSAFVMRQIEASTEKQARLQEVFTKLAKSLDHTERQVELAKADAKALLAEQTAVDRATEKVTGDARAVEDEMLAIVGDQSTADKSGSRTGKDVASLRKAVREQDLIAVGVQNELAKLQVDVLNTEAHNVRLADTMKLLDEECDDKASTIEKYEVEIKRRNDEIERKTRDIDALNRKLEKMVSGMPGETDTGPLEAVVRNLQAEITTKGTESKELQRRWIQCQTELVSLQNDNGSLTETVARMRAEHTVLFQKRRRLEQQLEQQQKDLRALNASMGRLGVDLQRVNALIAQNSSAREALREDNFNLENKVMADLRGMETEAASLSGQIDMTRHSKRDVLAEIVETERQIMLWERKIMLEKEMAAVLDPTVGQDVVGEMKREIHRMELRLGELMRLQEKLMQDMEKSLSKREVIGMKGRATQARAAQTVHADPSMTRGQLDKATTELQRSVKDTEREVTATEQRLVDLEAQRGELQGRLLQVDASCAEMRGQEEGLRQDIDAAAQRKLQLLLATSRQQKRAKRLEDMEAGKHKTVVEDPAQLDAEIVKANDKLQRVVGLLHELRASAPEVSAEVERMLAHVAQL